MKILITGSSKGIGLAVSNYFLSKGFNVIGIDILPSSINNPHYQHFICDISNKNNLVGTINVTKKYGFQKTIKSILFNASASARNGFEFDQYVASKAGVVGYMKHVASLLAKQGVTCNSISLGGVVTDSNKEVMDDPKLWKQIMDVTPLKKWASLDEVCEWVYFLLIINKSMSGQDLLIDNGENDLNNTFVWPKAY